MFGEERFETDHFVVLCETDSVFIDEISDNDSDLDESPPPLLSRASSQSVKEEQSRRSLALSAATSSLEKSSQRARTTSSESDDKSAIPELTRPPSQKRPPLPTSAIHSSRNSASLVEDVCTICFDSLPSAELWGGGELQKSCRCDIKVCLGCLSSSAKSDIARGVKPVCPFMVSSNQRCKVPLDPTLLGQMLRNQCATCPDLGDVAMDKKNLLSVGCALEAFHKFCATCLRNDVIESICKRRMLPKCLRYAECKYDYDEDSLREVLTAAKGLDHSDGELNLGDDEIDDIMEQWQRLRLDSLQSSWKGNKKCLEIDCHGYLQATLQMVRQAHRGDGSVGVKCSHCHKEFCWGCQVKNSLFCSLNEQLD